MKVISSEIMLGALEILKLQSEHLMKLLNISSKITDALEMEKNTVQRQIDFIDQKIEMIKTISFEFNTAPYERFYNPLPTKKILELFNLGDSDFVKSDYCNECGGNGFKINNSNHEQCESCEELHNQEVKADRLFDELKGN